MNISNIWQRCKQALGAGYIFLRYKDKLPLPENYSCKVKYALPFEGLWTVVNGGVTRDFSHSWDTLTQRFAYDFLVIGEEGKTYRGKLEQPTNYLCYGLNILAPADGTVVHVESGCIDSIIDKEGNAHCNSRHICGNHIIIKHAKDEFSFLAHLMKGSIKVKTGDSVKQGQIIAKCGNTGVSTQPHLHFHLQNKRSFYTSLGLPVEFDGITAQPKENYHVFDSRKKQNTFMEISGTKYIGRGQEVGNVQDEEQDADSAAEGFAEAAPDGKSYRARRMEWLEVYNFGTIENLTFADITNAWNLAFSDHIVPANMTPEKVKAYFKVTGVNREQSFGAVYKDKLIGLLINSIDHYNGRTAAYAAMAGIVPEHRGREIFSQLFTYTKKSLKSSGVTHYYIEVITTNERALNIYKKKGGKIDREFSCITGKMDSGFYNNAEVRVLPLSSFPEEELSKYKPSYSNRVSALRRNADDYQIAYIMSESRKSAVVFSTEGAIQQVMFNGADDCDLLRAVLTRLSQNFETLQISNIPVTETELIDELQNIGFGILVNQYEISIEL